VRPACSGPPESQFPDAAVYQKFVGPSSFLLLQHGPNSIRPPLFHNPKVSSCSFCSTFYNAGFSLHPLTNFFPQVETDWFFGLRLFSPCIDGVPFCPRALIDLCLRRALCFVLFFLFFSFRRWRSALVSRVDPLPSLPLLHHSMVGFFLPFL